MNRVLCVWLPAWPLQRLLAAQPALDGQRVLIHAGVAGQGQRVVGCSEPAGAEGVRAGMPLAEALALVQRGEDQAARAAVHLQAHDPAADLEALRRLAEWSEQFSPLVGWEAAAEPASLLMDVTGLGPLFAGERGLARQVAAAFGGRGYRTCLAIADTLAAAWALAHQPPDSSADPQIVPPGRTREALWPLGVELLRAPPETIRWLQQLGVQRIGQLLAMPRPALAARFGPELLRRLDQALGVLPEPICSHRPPPALAADWLLEHPTERRDELEWIVGQLLRRITAGLAKRGEGVLQLECRLDCVAAAGPLRLRVGLFRPSATADHLLQLLRMQLDQLVLAGPVGRLQVQATLTARCQLRQRTLFAGPEGGGQAEEDTGEEWSASSQWGALLERLSSRLGEDRVLQVRLHDDGQPERAWEARPWTGQPERARRAGSKGSQDADPASDGPLAVLRPLELYCPPVPLPHVVALAPDGPPLQLVFPLARPPITCRLIRHWGPERIETGWWRGPSVRRDYYRVETEGGERFWIFRRLQDGRWFLHGAFA